MTSALFWIPFILGAVLIAAVIIVIIIGGPGELLFGAKRKR